MKVVAILPAAGAGTRMGLPSMPKVLIRISGEPMILRTLRAIEKSEVATGALIAVRPEDEDLIERTISGRVSLPVEFVSGGAERQDSVRNAFDSLAASPDDLVLIHDADRPFVAPEVIRRTVDLARSTGAAICALRVTDTLKEVSAEGQVVLTHDRERFWRAQTPQVFRFDLLKRAYSLDPGGQPAASDEATIVERAGITVRVVEGSPHNIKITYPEDIAFGDWLVRGDSSLSRA
ncbi:MAG: 2-C-methyl-D-erythritol 4-phosphate cytidylyltransferase [Acidobacteria bacterium]|nr:2-C-methyl-D-erythritol 4-phosphate cytidylyltransferase [Acidobacteriota bacterium]